MSSGARKNEKIAECKVVILGDVSVGKSTVAHRMALGHTITNLGPTIAAGYVCIPKNNVKLNIWDSSGSERFNRLLPMYVRGAEIIILAYDLTRPHTVEKLIQYHSHFIEELPETAKSTWIIMGNKSDLLSSSDVNDTDMCSESLAWARAEEFAVASEKQHFVVSAYSGKNISTLLETLLSTAEDMTQKSNIKKDAGVIQLMPSGPGFESGTENNSMIGEAVANFKQRLSATSNCCS